MRRSSKLAERTRLETWVFIVKCNTKVLDRVRQENRCTTYSYKVWEGKRERDLDFRPEDTIIASVLSSFSLSLFNVIQDLMRGCRLLELRFVSE